MSTARFVSLSDALASDAVDAAAVDVLAVDAVVVDVGAVIVIAGADKLVKSASVESALDEDTSVENASDDDISVDDTVSSEKIELEIIITAFTCLFVCPLRYRFRTLSVR